MRVKKWFLAAAGIIFLEGVILIVLFFILPVDKVYGGMEYRIGDGVVSPESGTEDEEPDDDAKGLSFPDSPSDKGGAKKREKKVKDIYEAHKKELVLVNASHELDEDYDASLRSICGGRLQASERMYRPLVELLAAAEEEGHQYWIASAWRSRGKQQKLVDEDVRRAMDQGMTREQALKETYKETMPAGYSEHETGLALDILCSGNMRMDQSQKKEPGNVWLRENSWRYGFVLRYPEDKEKITGIRYEPWHFRYVGKQAAAYMHENKLTLEEFWERL